MAVKLRLMRMGKKKQPTYRIVASDNRSPRDGRFIEIIGTYAPREEPSAVSVDNKRAVEWLTQGAKASDRVRKLLEISGAWGEFTALRGEKPAKPGRKRKASQKPAKAAKKKAVAQAAKQPGKKAAKKAAAAKANELEQAGEEPSEAPAGGAPETAAEQAAGEGSPAEEASEQEAPPAESSSEEG